MAQSNKTNKKINWKEITKAYEKMEEFIPDLSTGIMDHIIYDDEGMDEE